MVLATLLCYLGFTALCLSMSRHYEALIGGSLSVARSRWLKLMGWGTLLASLWAAVWALSLGQALVQWSAALMASAVVLVFAMSYWPRLALSMAGIGALLAPVAACLQHSA
ncbi:MULTISPECIES: DUF3325 domain-containing protein [unclassified Pseudomonas]|uniref:DUF3325 domain-containing protein n=1 Tax=unclassified Pseudomonas TaxID=196821 RepID=UPI000D38D60F|nr:MULTISPECIES: DUF3325 domain-containing protein [unclassified Pseudomonas]RAU46867.1 DUF3325 domain-containing protein [Pseudomonas sp. RIT 409]RAU54483.1 DUF3325 domain-containing protein [Pseudomonas sp. RIT 412]